MSSGGNGRLGYEQLRDVTRVPTGSTLLWREVKIRAEGGGRKTRVEAAVIVEVTVLGPECWLGCHWILCSKKVTTDFLMWAETR